MPASSAAWIVAMLSRPVGRAVHPGHAHAAQAQSRNARPRCSQLQLPHRLLPRDVHESSTHPALSNSFRKKDKECALCSSGRTPQAAFCEDGLLEDSHRR